MSDAFMAALAVDLAPHLEALKQASAGTAQSRAEGIARLSGGAVTATPDQLAAIEAAACEELCTQLRERLRDVARVYAQTITTTLQLDRKS